MKDNKRKTYVDPFNHVYKQIGTELTPTTIEDIQRSLKAGGGYGFDESEGNIVAVWRVWYFEKQNTENLVGSIPWHIFEP